MKIAIAHFNTGWVNVPGGVEKVTCNLANALYERGHEVCIFYRDRNEGNPYFPINPKINMVNILFSKGEKVISDKLPVRLRLMREVTRIFSQNLAQGINAKYKGRQYGNVIEELFDEYAPDVVLSCSVPSAKYVIEDGHCKVPVVEMIHSHPDIQFPLFSKEELDAAGKCKVIQILLPSGIPTAKRYFPNVPIKVIGNAVYPNDQKAKPGIKKDTYTISCVGHVVGGKQQKLLAESFALIADNFPDWRIEFWGNNQTFYAKSLDKWIKHHHLEDRIYLKGTTTHIFDVYARSDIFCLPSRCEGFPLALTEAMEAGLPAIGLKNCTGVSDLIEDGKSGFLVDGTPEALAKKLDILMQSPELRIEMGNRGMEIVAKYKPDHIWEQWEHLLQDVVRNKKG